MFFVKVEEWSKVSMCNTKKIGLKGEKCSILQGIKITPFDVNGVHNPVKRGKILSK